MISKMKLNKDALMATFKTQDNDELDIQELSIDHKEHPKAQKNQGRDSPEFINSNGCDIQGEEAK